MRGRARNLRRGDRGAGMLEASIVTPIIMLVVVGVLEWGMLFKNELSLGNATRDSARAAAAAATAPLADWHVLDKADQLRAQVSGDIERIVVYRATSFDSDPPAACLTNPIGQGVSTPDPGGLKCNVYGPQHLGISESAFMDSGFTARTYWDASTRDAIQDADGTEFIGVYVVYDHHWVTGFLPSQPTLTKRTIARIEPRNA